MNNNKLHAANDKEYMTVEEASEYLRIKPTAIRNYLYLRKLKTFKFKNLTLLDSSEVHRWKKRQK